MPKCSRWLKIIRFGQDQMHIGAQGICSQVTMWCCCGNSSNPQAKPAAGRSLFLPSALFSFLISRCCSSVSISVSESGGWRGVVGLSQRLNVHKLDTETHRTRTEFPSGKSARNKRDGGKIWHEDLRWWMMRMMMRRMTFFKVFPSQVPQDSQIVYSKISLFCRRSTYHRLNLFHAFLLQLTDFLLVFCGFQRAADVIWCLGSRPGHFKGGSAACCEGTAPGMWMSLWKMSKWHWKL